MPSEFTRRPRLQKGAFVIYESQTSDSASRTIPFQYNPEQVRRTLAQRTPQRSAESSGSAREDVLRVEGPPVETITLTVMLNAVDQLEHPDQNRATRESGLGPVLATLELLITPPSLQAEEIRSMAERGEVQLAPASLPLTLLVWGQNRVVPVKITSFAVAEEAFDPKLNPIVAKVDLSMQVLTYMELEADTVGMDAYVAYLETKEGLADRYQSPGGQNPM